MKEENIKNIKAKYKFGSSSLKEEAFLFDNVDDSETVIKTWSTFVKKNKIITPSNFNNVLWKSFDKKITINNKFKFISAAASILLIITLYIYNINNEGLSYGEKEALLYEARSMFIKQKVKPIHRVIVESDLIIVYTKID